jgi:hypothetical protein
MTSDCLRRWAGTDGISVTLELPPQEPLFLEPVSIILFRIVEECLARLLLNESASSVAVAVTRRAGEPGSGLRDLAAMFDAPPSEDILANLVRRKTADLPKRKWQTSPVFCESPREKTPQYCQAPFRPERPSIRKEEGLEGFAPSMPSITRAAWLIP